MPRDIETQRREATRALDQSKRGELGQFMTPRATAQFMASMFGKSKEPVHLLEAGAGIGSLIDAFLNRMVKEKNGAPAKVTAYEIDASLRTYLEENLAAYIKRFKATNRALSCHVIDGDFILADRPRTATYTHAILNPPYKKINSHSEHRLALRRAGMEHVNLYTAFVALVLAQLRSGGELVTIIPRSFCNGLYYRPFREFLLRNAAIKRMHLFTSRKKAFKEDDVLQENIILHLIKGASQGRVTISTSTDDTLTDLKKRAFPFTAVVKPGDEEAFIHVPHLDQVFDLERASNIRCTLQEIGLQVSTGPVVDFRFKEHLKSKPTKGAVPLLYPVHFNGTGIDWPKTSKKPNAIALNKDTQKMMVPNGFYTVVKRFSSKEERQRIVARVINPRELASEHIGIENHLNYFHTDKKGMHEDVAYGLAAYLNSSFVDEHFRSFNGHTQVNATDLKSMKYPSRAALMRLGKWAKTLDRFTPERLDKKVKAIL